MTENSERRLIDALQNIIECTKLRAGRRLKPGELLDDEIINGVAAMARAALDDSGIPVRKTGRFSEAFDNAVNR